MSTKTKRITARITKFNTGPHAQKLTKVFEAMNHRSLGQKHFDHAKIYIRELMAAAKEVTVHADMQDTLDANPNQKLQDRKLTFHLVYMTPSRTDEDILTSASIRGLIGQEEAFCFERELPLRVLSQHVEFRHMQRTCEPLDYQSDDFKYAVAFSLALSNVLGKMMTAGSAPIPCLIPHTDGVFLGVAQHGGDFWTNTYAAFRKYDDDKPFVGKIGGDVFGSPVTIELKTSLGRRELSYRQEELRDRLLLPDVFDKDRVTARGIDIHSLCTMHDIIPEWEKASWHAMCRKLEEVTRSPLWQEEGQRALRNLKRQEYN